MMNDHTRITLAGEVTDLFGHRFVLSSPLGRHLADLGPKGAEQVTLAIGDKVTVTGDRKPSEVKVHTLVLRDHTFELRSHTDEAGHAPEAERLALAAVRDAGFEPLGAARHKPNHVEIVGRRGHERVEFQVELDGRIRKQKPARLPPREEAAS